ncbi:MAG: hypothetical protein ABIQ44_04455, partial [Chloroflexia bacterium]
GMIEEVIETIVPVSSEVASFIEENEGLLGSIKAELEAEANQCIAERYAADTVSRVEHGPVEFKAEITTEEFMRGVMPRHFAVMRSDVWLTAVPADAAE